MHIFSLVSFQPSLFGSLLFLLPPQSVKEKYIRPLFTCGVANTIFSYSSGILHILRPLWQINTFSFYLFFSQWQCGYTIVFISTCTYEVTFKDLWNVTFERRCEMNKNFNFNFNFNFFNSSIANVEMYFSFLVNIHTYIFKYSLFLPWAN